MTSRKHLLLTGATCLLLATLMTSCDADNKSERRLRRLERRRRRKSNTASHDSVYGQQFKSDTDIVHYLKIYGQDSMIWKCKNAVQPLYDGKPLPLIELNCETLGVFKSVDWFLNGERLSPSGDDHFKQTIVPHFSSGSYFSRWLDFKLKIYNATPKDSGIYTFTAHSQDGTKLTHQIYVDISKKMKRKSQYLRSRKLKKREYRRYYMFHNQRKQDGGRRTTSRKSNVIKTGKNSYFMV